MKKQRPVQRGPIAIRRQLNLLERAVNATRIRLQRAPSGDDYTRLTALKACQQALYWALRENAASPMDTYARVK